MKLFFLLCSALVFAATGFYLGYTIHELSWRTLLATCAGATAGLGMSSSILHVCKLWQAQQK